MVTIAKLAREELEDMAREQYARAYSSRPRVRQGPTHSNAGAALRTMGEEVPVLHIRGWPYDLIPVGFTDGVRLLEIKQRLDRMEESDLEGYQASVEAVVRLAKHYLRPHGWRGILWRLHIRPSPLRNATEAEVGNVLGFFLRSRMTSSVVYRGE